MDRCLAEGRLDAAVQALELGRALVLHATTISADVPARLDALGRGELAQSWRQELARTGPFPWDGVTGLFDDGLAIPPDVRHQVLDALRSAPTGADWLVKPTVGELTSGLAAAGYDAFVYLLPPGPGRSGCALVLSAHGLEKLSLPDLHNEPVSAYRAALQAWAQTQSIRPWRAALTSTCDWAWTAVVGPILRHAGLWQLDRPPRLVLIPTGNLSGIPWHAARSATTNGSPHYAIQDAVFSYAASARQLIGASRRPAQPWSTQPVLVANPTGDLELATAEGDELRRRCYPGAVCLGRFSPSSLPVRGRGTPREVLAWLPVEDRATALLMLMFHHYLVRESLGPAEALRAAQFWMIDPDRPELPGLTGKLAGLASRRWLSDINAWGAFSYQGARVTAPDWSSARG